MEKLGSSRASQQMGPTHYFIMLWTAAWGHSGFVVVFFFKSMVAAEAAPAFPTSAV